MIRLLEERAATGVEIKIIGKLKWQSGRVAVRKLVQMRLHPRAIIQDGKSAFLGSQSLREIELEKRRDVGIILKDGKAVAHMRKIFQEDWALAGQYGEQGRELAEPVTRLARKVAKAVARDLPLTPVLEVVVKEVAPGIEINAQQVEGTAKEAVREAVQEVVLDVVEKVSADKG